MQQERLYPVMRKNTTRLIPFTPAHIADAVHIWNAAAHTDYLINEHFLSYNLIPSTGEVIEGRIAIQNGAAVGFALACTVTNDPSITLGWVSAVAVEPSLQRQGIGSELLAGAEGWLKEKGCKRIRIGGNLRPTLPGLPYAMRETAVFFEKRDYQSPSRQPYEYDIARSLKDYQSIYSKPAHADLAPMQPGDEYVLLEFLVRSLRVRQKQRARI